MFQKVSKQFPSKKIAPQLGLEFGLGLRLRLGSGAVFVRAICPRTVPKDVLKCQCILF